MEIRILDVNDAFVFQTLRLKGLITEPEAFGSTFDREERYSLETVARRLKPTDSKFTLGAFDENHSLAGMVTFIRGESPKTAHIGNVYGMYIEPVHRRQGLGKALLLDLLKKAGKENVEQIHLSVVSGNAAAKNLYKSMGFKTYGVEKHALKFNGKYYDEDLMVLFLRT
ncbi:GNAT family N-acetyltransferase [Metabacillus sp. 84]|uniref:GNAT family N-acetyltransferase n=1 Tax=unclassified Metabacillus TaxID=2675274 RepID=UPI003CF4C67D